MPLIKLKRLKIATLVLLVSLGFSFGSPFFLNDSYATSHGGLDINWGVPSGDPIFVVDDFKPCDVEKRKVTVKNEYDEPKLISVIGTNTQETGDIADVIDFVISANGTDIYGGTAGAKTLKDFFEEAVDPGGITLATLNHDQSEDFFFTATFDCDAGNEYQKKKVVFDLKIGVLVEDHQCPDVDGVVKVYYPEGWHAIVGYDENQWGADIVYNVGDNNFVQCYFPTTGNVGIQTDWLSAANFIQEKINELIADGWTLITNGYDWGLPVQEYLAKNFPFTF